MEKRIPASMRTRGLQGGRRNGERILPGHARPRARRPAAGRLRRRARRHQGDRDLLPTLRARALPGAPPRPRSPRTSGPSSRPASRPPTRRRAGRSPATSPPASSPTTAVTCRRPSPRTVAARQGTRRACRVKGDGAAPPRLRRPAPPGCSCSCRGRPRSSQWPSPAPLSWHAPPTLRDPATEGRALPEALLERLAEVRAAQPGKRIELWWQDGARVGQKNKLTRRWARRGTRPRAPHDQRTAWAYVFGAIRPGEGKGAGLVMPFCDT